MFGLCLIFNSWMAGKETAEHSCQMFYHYSLFHSWVKASQVINCPPCVPSVLKRLFCRHLLLPSPLKRAVVQGRLDIAKTCFFPSSLQHLPLRPLHLQERTVQLCHQPPALLTASPAPTLRALMAATWEACAIP